MAVQVEAVAVAVLVAPLTQLVLEVVLVYTAKDPMGPVVLDQLMMVRGVLVDLAAKTHRKQASPPLVTYIVLVTPLAQERLVEAGVVQTTQPQNRMMVLVEQ
jgi:hypothetical protein